ncbi:unnamed protein product [Fraxinus pennsylvanica]|uniref:NB-ARC domain-containing protein n=1 Tax=Fraxinus pennsylvanica TaxID=56036 RepID=A0AAD2DKK1_9LAMI|nr:unnamed protein product [Fraxinus pennsylvanica]
MKERNDIEIVKPSNTFCSARSISVIVELLDQKKRIIDMLIRPNLEVCIISVVGMGGLSKTTLARQIYHDPDIASHFDILAWVTVSQRYYEQEVLSRLLHSMRDLNHELYADPDCYVHHMAPQSEDGSWILLRHLVFDKDPYPRELEKFGRMIARNCRGLPLALILIGGVLYKAERTRDYWIIHDEVRDFCRTKTKEKFNSGDEYLTEVHDNLRHITILSDLKDQIPPNLILHTIVIYAIAKNINNRADAQITIVYKIKFGYLILQFCENTNMTKIVMDFWKILNVRFEIFLSFHQAEVPQDIMDTAGFDFTTTEVKVKVEVYRSSLQSPYLMSPIQEDTFLYQTPNVAADSSILPEFEISYNERSNQDQHTEPHHVIELSTKSGFHYCHVEANFWLLTRFLHPTHRQGQ